MRSVLFALIVVLVLNVNGDASLRRKIVFHVVVKNTDPEDIKSLIKEAAENGFNTVILGIFGVRFKSLGAIKEKVRTWSVNELANVVSFARDLNMDVIPEIKLLTHQEHFLRQSYHEFMFNSVTYDPRREKLYTEVVFPVLNEINDLIKPHAVHIGHDEVAGHSERSRKKWLRPGEKMLPADLFLKDVLRIHDFLKQRGIETWMWGDMLISPDEFPSMAPRHLHGSAKGYGQELRKRLPRDIVICDWHYMDKQKDFPSLAAFKAEGFRVLGATWERPETIQNFSRYAAEHGAEGMIATTWFYVQRKKWGVVNRIIKESGRAFLANFPDP